MAADSVLVRVRWECPLCEMRRSSIYQADYERRGRSSLLNHIRHTDDDAHGPWREIPESLTKEELRQSLTVEPMSFGSK